MARFVCPTCGEEHEGQPMDVGFRRPDHFLRIPEDDRDDRIRCDNNLCQTRDDRCFIRCVLESPVEGTEEAFRWGPWAEVDGAVFARYIELWDAEDVSAEPPFAGQIANELPPYTGCEGLDVEVRFQSGNDRPRLFVTASEHPLGVDQRRGISQQRLAEILSRYGWSPEHD